MENNISLVFGKRVRSLRNSKKLSQEKLAEQSGLHPTYIGQIERGEKSPTIDSIYKLAGGLGLSMSEFLKNMESENNSELYADKIYNEILSLPPKKQKEIYDILMRIMNF